MPLQHLLMYYFKKVLIVQFWCKIYIYIYKKLVKEKLVTFSFSNKKFLNIFFKPMRSYVIFLTFFNYKYLKRKESFSL